tara:strand:+ start:196 stop:882 length:687 start_codon:yes stop_codon:yes gene_type:complete
MIETTNTAVILVGGLGERLKPLTNTIPKPLLKFGNSTILDTIIINLVKNKYNHIILAAKYKSENFEKEILRLSKNFPEIKFEISIEKKALGTCGPIKLLEKKLPNIFLLINGDVITNANFLEANINFKKSKSPLLIFSKEIIRPFEFGELIIEKDKIINIKEKPIISSEILAGIYLMKKTLIAEIPENKYYGMDELIRALLDKKIKVDRFLIQDFWLDVGDMKYFRKK